MTPVTLVPITALIATPPLPEPEFVTVLLLLTAPEETTIPPPIVLLLLSVTEPVPEIPPLIVRTCVPLALLLVNIFSVPLVVVTAVVLIVRAEVAEFSMTWVTFPPIPPLIVTRPELVPVLVTVPVLLTAAVLTVTVLVVPELSIVTLPVPVMPPLMVIVPVVPTLAIVRLLPLSAIAPE